MPSATTQKGHVLSHGSTVTLALAGAIIVTVAGLVFSAATTTADFRNAERRIQQLESGREVDRAQLADQAALLRVQGERLAAMKQQLDRIESKIDNLPTAPRRVPLSEATPP